MRIVRTCFKNAGLGFTASLFFLAIAAYQGGLPLSEQTREELRQHLQLACSAAPAGTRHR